MTVNLNVTPPVDLPRGIYRHFKGAEYEVLRLAQHSETEEWLVVYRQCYSDGSWWVRPLSIFADTVEVAGEEVPRFEFQGAKPDKAMD
ncbi:DUF1653 domain-containing protein [Marinospirillum insulare]|uniref:DUF1653 domain-containing protein n=1 Tax=Marinospirillum insulare TaxID=217169 RepID=A0ABQ5ZT38_9GAMM|nr:DUF1653 domain-containing protein [Marinospirillum insulare]GLR63309.1 hypothetical protein GCM10007878_07440 [Marinospirillum insulare]